MKGLVEWYCAKACQYPYNCPLSPIEEVAKEGALIACYCALRRRIRVWKKLENRLELLHEVEDVEASDDEEVKEIIREKLGIEVDTVVGHE